MSRRSRTGEVDPIPAPEERPERPARASAPFDFGDIDAAIGDLTADVPAGPVNAVELPPAPSSASTSVPGLAAVEAGFGLTDEQLPVPRPVSPGRPDAFAITGDQKDSAPAPPAARPPSAPPGAWSGPPPAVQYPPPSAAPRPAPGQYLPSSAPPRPPVATPAPPGFSGPASSGLPPAGRPIQNIETAFVRNPLLAARPSAPAPAGPPPGPDPHAPTAAQPSVGAPPRGRLIVQGGDWNGTTWYLNRAETRLGRGEENDIVVLDIGVSRQHLVFVRHPQGFRLVDLQSGNGTYVNGRRVVEAEVYDGDRIDMGHTTLLFGTIGQPRLRAPGTGEHGRAGGRQLPTSWLIVMALTTFFTVLGTMYLVRTLKGDDAPPPTLTTTREAVANQDWSAARAALEQARSAGADEAELAELDARIGREEKAQGLIEQARALMAAPVATDAAKAMPEKVGALLAEVPPTSVYSGDARNLEGQAERMRIDALLDEIEGMVDEGRSAAALVRVEAILEEAPGNPRAKALRRRLAEDR